MCIFWFLKSVFRQNRGGDFLFFPRGSKAVARLWTVTLPQPWQIWMPQRGVENIFIPVWLKILPTSFLLSLLLFHFLDTPFFCLPLSSKTRLASFVIFLLIPVPNIVLTHQVPHSSAQHSDLAAGLPEEFLAYDYPLIFHSRTDTHSLTHKRVCTHTHSQAAGCNKLKEWAVLFYCLWRKVYCFLFQGVWTDLPTHSKMSKCHWFVFEWSV